MIVVIDMGFTPILITERLGHSDFYIIEDKNAV